MSRIKEKVTYPSDWKTKKLGELGTFLKGKGIAKSETKANGLPCIRYGEIYTHHHYYIKEFYSFIDEETAKKSIEIRKGDILFAGSGETMGEIGKSVAFIHDEKAYAGGDIIILRTQGVNSQYLAFALNEGRLAKERAKLGQGHSVVHIYSKELKELVVNLPPDIEQQKIADIISIWDKAIELKEKLIEQKK
ncbi:MAG: restriction endonuclease subunit S, partial [Clostridiales bacterium]|nr:restriction endonuclease subunit S [Clostridiales bacterium]